MMGIDRSEHPVAKLNFIKLFPKFFKIAICGLLLLFAGGMIGLFALNKPTLIGLPEIWGIIMLVKVLLYVTIGINSILIKEMLIPEMVEANPQAVEDESLEVSSKPTINLKRVLNINLLLTVVVLVLGAVVQVTLK